MKRPVPPVQLVPLVRTRRRLIGTLLLATTGLAWGAGPAVDATAGTSLPALAAQFRVTLTRPGQPAQQQTWQLTRSEALITWLKGSGTEELWRRDRSGIRLERVMRADRHVIDYSAGELRALAVAVDWADLATLFPADQLAQLTARPLRPSAGKTQHWAGRIGHDQVDLLWDPVAQLPLRLARRGPGGRVLFERTALRAVAPAHWPQAGAGSDDFQRVDASDFGDMAHNPVVRKAQAWDARAGWRQAHSH